MLRTKLSENKTVPDYSWQNDWRPALLLLVALVVLLTNYACVLNTVYYRTDSPFFDSAAYTNQIAQVDGTLRHHGVVAALRSAMTQTTAPLPFLEVIGLAELRLIGGNITRRLGVALQAAWLLVLAVALFFYRVRIRGQNGWASVAFTAPFLMFDAIFGPNGGLSDFRLDLSLYIFVSITLVLYLIGEEFDDARVWFLTGLAAGLTCLTRGTAPVYLSVMLGPVLLFRLWRSKDRGHLLRHVGVMLAPAVLLAGVFIAFNFSYLYYYYVVWNADANAKLPLRRSVFHIFQGLAHIGPELLLALALFGSAVFVERIRTSEGLRFGKAIRDIDWKLLYLGFAPVVFLALRGAGVNPFVSMPAVFGFTMFGLAPVKGSAPVFRTLLSTVAMVGVILACGWNAVGAVPRHVPASHARIEALKQGIELMRADASAKGLKRVRFATSHLWNFHTAYLKNVLIYEYGGDVGDEGVAGPDGILWTTPYENLFGAAVPVQWNQDVAGSSDAEKIETLFRLAHEGLDYVFFPDEPTIDTLERNIRHNYINLKVRAIKKRFLESGEWVPVGDLLEITPDEHVQMYAKKLPQ